VQAQVILFKEQLRQTLMEQVQIGRPAAYKEVADWLGLVPPLTIYRVTVALETLIEEDVAAGRPMLAAMAVSKVPPRIPGRGFFQAARNLGRFSGGLTGQDAIAFHALECSECLLITSVSARTDFGGEGRAVVADARACTAQTPF
jgi:hypothetical protein